VTIYFNQTLWGFFESFEAFFVGINQPNGKDVRITVRDTGANSLFVQAPGATANGIFYSTAKLPGVNYYAMVQEWPSLFLWNDLRRLAIIATGLPVRSEYVPASSTSLTYGQIPILTDFEPIITEGPEARSRFQYFASGSQYRFVDLQSTIPLKTFGISFQWVAKDGSFSPLEIPPGDQASIKLVFVRKGAGYQTYGELEDGSQFAHHVLTQHQAQEQGIVGGKKGRMAARK
jgi:hypothetical protein